jgi:hypothetical protein
MVRSFRGKFTNKKKKIVDILSQQKGSGMEDNKSNSIKELMEIPGVGKSIALDLWNIGIRKIADLQNFDAEHLYILSNQYAGIQQDKCLLYVFRCAVYYANTSPEERQDEKLKWWSWKDKI